LGLGKIFVSSLCLGISVSFAYLLSGNAKSALSFFIFDSINNTTNPTIQPLVMLSTLILAVFSIFSMAKMFRHIYENKIRGIIVAIFGFFGSILCFGFQESFQIIILGAGLWCIGIIIIFTARNIKINSGKQII